MDEPSRLIKAGLTARLENLHPARLCQSGLVGAERGKHFRGGFEGGVDSEADLPADGGQLGAREAPDSSPRSLWPIPPA